MLVGTLLENLHFFSAKYSFWCFSGEQEQNENNKVFVVDCFVIFQAVSSSKCIIPEIKSEGWIHIWHRSSLCVCASLHLLSFTCKLLCLVVPYKSVMNINGKMHVKSLAQYLTNSKCWLKLTIYYRSFLKEKHFCG